jgi:hypothetical protein
MDIVIQNLKVELYSNLSFDDAISFKEKYYLLYIDNIY